MVDTARQIARALSFLAVNFFAGVVMLVFVTVTLSLALSLAVTVVGGLFFAFVKVSGARRAGLLQMAHLELATGRPIPRPEPPPARSGVWNVMTGPLVDVVSWRAVGFWWLEAFLSILTTTIVFSLISAGLVGLTLPLYALFIGGVGGDANLIGQSWFVVGGALALTAGLAGSLLALQIHHALARALLGRPRTAELEGRVTDLDAAQASALQAAEHERRRIERDLHDGTQQRLVALAMDLGMAKEKLDSDPDAARQLVAEAHDEIKETMAELRNFTRGLRPSVLEDRGLDAALSAVAARCPFPVDIAVELDRRLPATVESTAYFLVSEALTNVTRHAGATRAGVHISCHGPLLEVQISDDGRGGARLVSGGGLDGLAGRLAGFEGRLAVHSPVGGPTVIRGELPCGS